MKWPILLLLIGCGDTTATTTDAADAADPDAGGGACACAYGATSIAGTVSEAAAIELSGLAISRVLPDTMWANNDSGDGPRLFAMTMAGVSRGTLTLTGATATDWEDLAIGPCGAGSCLFTADIGDNAVARATVRIYEADEPAQIVGDATATFRTFEVQYPDGPHNAESLFVDPRDGASYVITKQASNPSKVFLMPRTAGAPATAVELGTITIPSGNLLVTGADLHVDACGTRLLVRTYTALFEFRGAPDATIAALIATTPVSVPVAIEPQGESVAYAADGRSYVTVSEGTAQPLTVVTCQ